VCNQRLDIVGARSLAASRSVAPMLTSLAVMAAVWSAVPQDPPPFDFRAAWHHVEAELHRRCDEAGVVGGALAFVRGGQIDGFAGHGFADRATQRVVDRDTIFHWASCTKTFTGIAVMQLRDRGKLRLEQAIVDTVPELRAVRDPFGPISAITLQHLMTHSAGFRAATWPWGGDKDWHPHEPTQWSQLVAMLPYTEVEFAPGTKFSYSNPGIVFLGRTIEALTGDEYEVHMEKNVLRPLGMSRSYFDTTPWHLQRYRSHSHAGKGAAAKDEGPDFDTGMAKYVTFLLGACEPGSDAAGVLARASLEAMWEPVLPTRADGSEHIGLCFFVQAHGGSRFATHTGGQRNFISFFYVHPASRTGAVGAFNTGSAGPVMAALRTLCMETLSLPLVKKG
jgi:CubicO group peptidase (beta-lactamase class C family)